ncbi:hypothetical protein CAPTEDRAFT_160698 [Capitella teleta]|uniref:Bicarbonate transporter-like transmembrane domain-containing protein n=1 Tax=Capitella teleta TaxID=283909 RepID=R7TJH6_CAPTE|nr:hypothetical protein CAPTEDRAFT_160698 [Capitella teleta]|eukprot:ELT93973.1 hypothetical protein CAPTEDRAFT_160698 [Capitella teleta]
MYARHEKIPMKDFAAEIRASMDVENFMSEAKLILDLHESTVEATLEKMVRFLLDNKEEPEVAVDEVRRALFTHDSVHQLARTIQGTCRTYGGGFDYDQSWVCILCSAPSIVKRRVAIARLKHSTNLGRTSQEVHFVILILTPTKEKGTKNAMETGRTFATMFADMDLRLRLLTARSDEEFKQFLYEHMKELSEEQASSDIDKIKDEPPKFDFEAAYSVRVIADFKRRWKHTWSDYRDGFVGPRTLQKTASTTIFLYFACILPNIALGVLNDKNTDGRINVKKVIYSQCMGGLFFHVFGGQPMVILLTTAPLALYTKVIYTICDDMGYEFDAMFACVGLWNSFFLFIYAFSDASRLMKWVTRSTEEIFSLFISIAFTVDALKDIVHDFEVNYECDANRSPTLNQTLAPTISPNSTGSPIESCMRERSLLFLLLAVGTLWVGLSLYNFTKTPFLNAGKRELLADYALPVAVLVMSFFGSYVFRAVNLDPFTYDDNPVFNPAPLHKLPWDGVLLGMGLGFCLSLLFFMDQNISQSMVNSPDNRMKKGSAYHWDLMIVSLINGMLTFFGLPMIHGALPHSPLHVRAMADVEDRVDQGHVYQKIIHVRETRVTGIISHILIGLSLFLLPNPMQYIPIAVLDGLFLYLAVTALSSNQMFERITLLVTEQAAYPPNHYIRTVPQRKVHLFTFLQLLQLLLMCFFGFFYIPYVKMCFPVLIILLLPVRHKLIPKAIEKKFLHALDGH